MNRNTMIYLVAFLLCIYAGGAYSDHNATQRYAACIAHHTVGECIEAPSSGCKIRVASKPEAP